MVGRGNEAKSQQEVEKGETVREEPWRERKNCKAILVILGWGETFGRMSMNGEWNSMKTKLSVWM